VSHCFQQHAQVYPTLTHIALDVLPVAASSVPCERLLSGGQQIATDCRTRLGSDRFEQLQILKFGWRKSIVDFALLNANVVEEVNAEDFRELLQLDIEIAQWNMDDM
jgi:hAT family C-terminal dimerisation region